MNAKTNLKKNNPTSIHFAYIAIIVLIAVVIALCAALYELNKIYTQSVRDNFRALAFSGMNNLNQIPESDEINTLLFPANKVKFPRPTDESIMVQYVQDPENSTLNINDGISSRYFMYEESKEDDGVRIGKAQACMRQVYVRFENAQDEAPSNFELVTTKKLADGRTVTIYKNKDCSRNTDKLLEQVKQIESY